MTFKGVLAAHNLAELDEKLGRKNNLNLIRLFLAALVVYSHSYLIHYQFQYEPMLRFIHFGNLGALAVWSFFLISGFLITKSGDRSSPFKFAAARGLRIFPALFLTILLCALVLGPIATNLSLKDYFSDPQTYTFLRRALLEKVPDALPGVFKGTGRTLSTVDQPLWTLASEWSLYTGILIFFTLRSCMRHTISWRRGGGICAAALLLIATMLPLPWHNAAGWFGFGALGSLCYFFRRHIWLSIPVAMIGIILTLVLLKTHVLIGAATLPFSLGYLLLVIGFHPGLSVSWYHRLGDYSYGTYILGWPIQQIVFPYSSGPVDLFLKSIPITLIFAALSWHILEKRALSLVGSKKLENCLRSLEIPARTRA